MAAVLQKADAPRRGRASGSGVHEGRPGRARPQERHWWAGQWPGRVGSSLPSRTFRAASEDGERTLGPEVSTGHPTGDGREALGPGSKFPAYSWEQLENGERAGAERGACGVAPPESGCSLPPLHRLQLSNLGFLNWRTTVLGSDSGLDQPCGLGLTFLLSIRDWS